MMKISIQLSKDTMLSVVERGEVIKVLWSRTRVRIARFSKRKVHGIDAKSMNTVGVGSVVEELTKMLVEGTNRCGK